MGFGGYGFRWAPYVSVGQKLAKANKRAAQIAKKQKRAPMPVVIEGRKIATSFWGKAWCENLEAYSDFANRLPRGATYVRNGSVVDLVINKGSILAIVAGSEPYTVAIEIGELNKASWKKIKQDCSASIDSLIDLLAGRLSDGVMRRLTDKKVGCFPAPSEIDLKCSCPDSSYCCKHIAAVMYGIGNRLDREPELLFVLRGVDHMELVSQAVSKENLDRELSSGSAGELSSLDLGELFGIELESHEPKTKSVARQRKTRIATVSPREIPTGTTSTIATKKKPAKLIERVDLESKKTPPTKSNKVPKPSNATVRAKAVSAAKSVSKKSSTKKSVNVRGSSVEKGTPKAKSGTKSSVRATRIAGSTDTKEKPNARTKPTSRRKLAVASK